MDPMGAQTGLTLLLGAVAVIVLVNWISERTGLPSAPLLVLVGIGYALVPGPNISLEPDVVMTCILPPLLFNAALESSLVGIRRNLRTVISLSVVLVLLTAASVGIAFGLLVSGATLAVGMVLGAAVAPTDPVAALAVARKEGLPLNIVTLIEGEGLLNDATALTTLSVAITVARGAAFSVPSAIREFALAALGGLAVGMVFAYFRRLLRRWRHDVLTANAISLATPFVTYLVAEELSASGVLAVVVCGLIVGHDSPRLESGASRLQTRAVWRLVNFLLEGLVFLLIGHQLPAILDDLGGYDLSTIVVAVSVTVAVVLVVRPLWLLLTQSLPRPLRTRLGNVSGSADAADADDANDANDADEPDGPDGPGESDTGRRRNRTSERLSGREVLVLSWAGTRGVVSLAAIFAVPFVTDSRAPFPDRDLLLFCTLVVVLVTLIGQGITFGPLVRALGLRADATDELRLRNRARAAAVQAALDRLDSLDQQDDVDVDPRVIDGVRQQLSARLERYQHRLNLLSDAAEAPAAPRYEAAVAIRRIAIDAQRDELVRWRDAGMLPDQSLRAIERELDHEESTLPMRTRRARRRTQRT
ncbi:cation:proton antiporter [Mycobacterium intracellulare]|uniref:cation:proton antiporter n=3 Tax=Mycobacterium intracellulare TaxID=1767 RepID=UPI0015579996|nr:cation:proton antiporter [Mycobacterium intracellulare]MCA2310290.1 cation:proton antiporter [Mycobacterium intracellulare subsp. chimaera]MCA2350417.1 cation:proton antiporter [Mycobacterium intracellulare subsp. chimaera]MCV7325285.1 cation:proton antiporter [Mycobacterium intracellulare subsp. chimaera]MDM3906708.1 cation:proton antiporter [Mycobacterium intracellulare subsp. chimaera]MDM3934098.1 cation:proton antiporter [Mycobacterium intracellulare subsp. chimaera]